MISAMFCKVMMIQIKPHAFCKLYFNLSIHGTSQFTIECELTSFAIYEIRIFISFTVSRHTEIR